MVKHNNQIQNLHFRKDWQKNVKTWFNQPAGKVRRRNARAAKAKKLAPRPVNALRPVVRCPTLKYKTRVRAGRGFTKAEVKAAGIKVKAARGVGIALDHRRRNMSEEAFQVNVQRLKLYKSKLVIFPRKANSKRHKAGDSAKNSRDNVKQVLSKQTLEIPSGASRVKPRPILPSERKATVVATLRKARTDAKRWGIREKLAAEKAEAVKSGLAKKKK